MTDPTMSDLIRAAAGKGSAETPAEPDKPTFSGSADGGVRGVPVEKPPPSMNDVLRALARERGGDG